MRTARSPKARQDAAATLSATPKRRGRPPRIKPESEAMQDTHSEVSTETEAHDDSE